MVHPSKSSVSIIIFHRVIQTEWQVKLLLAMIWSHFFSFSECIHNFSILIWYVFISNESVMKNYVTKMLFNTFLPLTENSSWLFCPSSLQKHFSSDLIASRVLDFFVLLSILNSYRLISCWNFLLTMFRLEISTVNFSFPRTIDFGVWQEKSVTKELHNRFLCELCPNL